ncbi:MAG: response regulator transcription factor [Flavobacteriaceae bacterium]|nr:response regulator transcription factor [Flavobacteriaceae bacterium]
METLRTIIVEDEKISREILKNYLAKYCPKVTLVGEASTIEEALVLIRNNELDLVFLDVEMPYGNAFDLLDRVGDVSFETVFVTAYSEYAMDALNQHAAFYVLKPISIDDLIKAVDYVVAIKEKEERLGNGLLKTTLEVAGCKITIPTLQGFEVLEIAAILYCKAADNYTEIFLKNNVKKLVSKTLKYFEDALISNNFVRVHKSFLVNVNAITAYNKGKGGSVTLVNGKEISVAASKKGTLLSFFK